MEMPFYQLYQLISIILTPLLHKTKPTSEVLLPCVPERLSEASLPASQTFSCLLTLSYPMKLRMPSKGPCPQTTSPSQTRVSQLGSCAHVDFYSASQILSWMSTSVPSKTCTCSWSLPKSKQDLHAFGYPQLNSCTQPPACPI